jgi:SAM-dependent methyltransferase
LKKAKKKPAYLPRVKAQYESLPYPPRDPEDERRGLQNTWLGWLPRINHYGFAGRRSFENARFLVAGAGTGDATIFLAEQLRDRGAEVVSLDMSRASTDIAKARARVRGLTNIRWVEASLLDLPGLGLAPFDYVDCSGVLHHLADPDAGLRALRAVLKDDGAMGLMVYARCGRTGVYQMQELLRLINRGETDMRVQLKNARAVLADLPPSNWFKRGEELVNDQNRGDAGLYDLLLHTQDRAYSIPELYEYLAKADLRLVEFCMPWARFHLDPDFLTDDPRLRERFAAMEPMQRQAAAELMTGNVIMHMVYAAPRADTVARLDDPDMVPFLFGLQDPEARHRIARYLASAGGAPVPMEQPGYTLSLDPGRWGDAFVHEMDGRRTVPKLLDAARARLGKPGLSDAELMEDFTSLYRQFNRADRMLLRHVSCRPFGRVSGVA